MDVNGRRRGGGDYSVLLMRGSVSQASGRCTRRGKMVRSTARCMSITVLLLTEGVDMRVRVVATKTMLRDLQPGDLFSDKDGTYWNRAMTGHVLAQAFICNNAELDDSDDFVYRLTIVKEGETTERNRHVIPEGFSPFAPPGTTLGEV
jgi:hypothetical protein